MTARILYIVGWLAVAVVIGTLPLEGLLAIWAPSIGPQLGNMAVGQIFLGLLGAAAMTMWHADPIPDRLTRQALREVERNHAIDQRIAELEQEAGLLP